MFNKILPLYGINPSECDVHTFGDGLINHTWKINHNGNAYILQQVNNSVFKQPSAIDQNLSMLNDHLKSAHPEYLFVAPLKDLSGKSLTEISGAYFRLFPFIKDSHTVNVVQHKEEAYEAAKQFGKFSKSLSNFEVKSLFIPLPDFHNIILRFNQFLSACENASTARKTLASASIAYILEQKHIVETYEQLIRDKQIPLRVIHHDTKISNVLFNTLNKGICVIDLDTVMPGYFISDVGDMLRTYLCAVSEEETNLDLISIRVDYFKAIYDGYMSEMGNTLTANEKSYFIYAGNFLIYMQALRFLTDYLQHDIYYGSKYEGHNLKRAENQLQLLKKYREAEKALISVI